MGVAGNKPTNAGVEVAIFVVVKADGRIEPLTREAEGVAPRRGFPRCANVVRGKIDHGIGVASVLN